MISLLYGLLAVVQAGLAVRLAAQKLALPAIVAVGVSADSAIVGVGSLLGVGEPLETLTLARFAAHAVLTPLLIVYAAGGTRLVPGAWLLAAALIVPGTVALWGLRFEPRRWAGTLRYVDAESGPPVAALITTVALLVAGIFAWVRHRRPWLLLGGVTLLVASAAAVAVPILGNAGEAVLLAAISVPGPPDAASR
ncbi:hypothetical protein ACFXJ8_08600 [Nonomuraea sp. NPDC059194]|uniref:hypothetical protein n=1 Tax=Nonomuraea sp. NPDC059194 TaxID=3346764 RepID=UPI0036A5539C